MTPSPAPTRRIAARLAKLLVVAIAALVAPVPAITFAGPVEARASWARAQALRAGPVRERLRALRDAREEAGRADPILARIAAAEGAALRSMGLEAAAAAAEALASDVGPARDPSRLQRGLVAARALDADGDVAGAIDRLEGVLAAAATAAPEVYGPALVLRARIAAERGDDRTLADVRRAATVLPTERVADRLLVIDVAGLARLRAGDGIGARRALAEQTRLYTDAMRRGEDVATPASRTWLRLELPRRLELPSPLEGGR